MGREFAYLICCVIVVYRIFKTFINVVKKDRINFVVQDIITDISLLLTFFLYLNFSLQITTFNHNIIYKYLGEGQADNILIRVVVEIAVFFLIKWAIDVILSFIQNLLFKDGFEEIGKSKVMSLLTALGVGTLKGFISLIGVFIVITIINTFVPDKLKISLFEDIKAYRQIETFINNTGTIKNYPSLITKDATTGITYYNGIRIEDGVKSNEEISNKARSLTKNAKSDREKAKILYSFVGAYVEYDYNKAENVSSNNFTTDSGAIEAFNTKKGICLDYACLYTAMARASGLKSRIAVGELYDRGEYIGHAWNEVYLEDENKWIQVDPTNYTAGNYFDNKKVEKNYKKDDIAYEG